MGHGGGSQASAPSRKSGWVEKGGSISALGTATSYTSPSVHTSYRHPRPQNGSVLYGNVDEAVWDEERASPRRQCSGLEQLGQSSPGSCGAGVRILVAASARRATSLGRVTCVKELGVTVSTWLQALHPPRRADKPCQAPKSEVVPDGPRLGCLHILQRQPGNRESNSLDSDGSEQ